MDGAAAGTQQVGVHAGIGEEIGVSGQVLAAILRRCPEAPDIAARAGLGRVPMADDRDPATVGAPGRGIEELLTATGRDALDASAVGGHDVDVLLQGQVGVPMATGDEGDAHAVRAPAGLAIVGWT